MSAVVDAIEKLTREVHALKRAVTTPPRKAYRPREVAEMTALGYDVVLQLIRSGELEAIQVGRLHVVTAASVDRLVARVGEVIELDSRRSA